MNKKGKIDNLKVAKFQLDDDLATFSGIANSNEMTRNGTYLDASENASLDGLKRPLLESHDWSGVPVGYVVFSATDNGLEYSATLFKSAANYQQYVDSIEAGVMSVSIGFTYGTITDEGALKDVDLLELSLTGIPADANATAHFSFEGKKEEYAMTDEQYQALLDAITALQSSIDKANDTLADMNKANEGDPDKKPADDDKNAEAMSLLHGIMNVADMPFIERMKFNKQIKEMENK